MTTTANGDHRNTAPGPGPIHGIRVLDVSTVYAAPINAMLLGDYGAEVIKVEHPRGEPARTHSHNKDGHGLWWKVISRNKCTVPFAAGDGFRDLRRRHGVPRPSALHDYPVHAAFVDGKRPAVHA